MRYTENKLKENKYIYIRIKDFFFCKTILLKHKKDTKTVDKMSTEESSRSSKPNQQDMINNIKK